MASLPKITYVPSAGGSTSFTLSQYPKYSEHWISKANHTVTDGGVVERHVFHQRFVYRLSFELLNSTDITAINTWWNDRAALGYSFTFFRFGLTDPGVTCIWQPSETEPQIAPMDENPSVWYSWTVEFWKVLT